MTEEQIALLKKYDTPSITNVVATYPDKDYCLGLYDPWYGQWYTDQTLKCMYPDLGRTVGYAVTCTYGLPEETENPLKFADVLRAIAKMPKPVVLVLKQNFPDEVKRINGLLGGNMMTAMKSAGVVGVISDGPSRDVDEIRPLGMQYMLTGVTAGHGKFVVQSINTAVEVCSMVVNPGEIIHMDENGAVKFPESAVEEVVKRCAVLSKLEEHRQELMRNTTDIEQLIKIMNGLYD